MGPHQLLLQGCSPPRPVVPTGRLDSHGWLRIFACRPMPGRVTCAAPTPAWGEYPSLWLLGRVGPRPPLLLPVASCAGLLTARFSRLAGVLRQHRWRGSPAVLHAAGFTCRVAARCTYGSCCRLLAPAQGRCPAGSCRQGPLGCRRLRAGWLHLLPSTALQREPQLAHLPQNVELLRAWRQPLCRQLGAALLAGLAGAASKAPAQSPALQLR